MPTMAQIVAGIIATFLSIVYFLLKRNADNKAEKAKIADEEEKKLADALKSNDRSAINSSINDINQL